MRWIRIWTQETLQSTTFQELTPYERGVWFSLLIMAGANIRNQGIVEIRDGVAFSVNGLAEFLNCSRRKLQKSLQKLTEVQKIEILPDRRIAIKNWEKYQTRYEKYYKTSNLNGINNGIKIGIDMHDRIEEDTDKEEDIYDKPVDKTPTKEMFREFKAIFYKHREGQPKIDGRKDGRLCKKLWKECQSNNPADPMAFWREQCDRLMEKFDIASIGGISSYWNSAIPKKGSYLPKGWK